MTNLNIHIRRLLLPIAPECSSIVTLILKQIYFYVFKKIYYLAASGLSCGIQCLHCIMRDLLLWLKDSLFVV